MQRENALRWSWMNVLNLKRADFLRHEFGTLDRAIESISYELLRKIGCRDDTALLTMNRLEEFDIDAYERELTKRDIHITSIEDDAYPSTLKTLPDPPIFLYAVGDLSILDQPCLSIVGTREMSEYGERVVRHLIPDIVRAHLVTVSGLAYGIDAAVAQETIACSGKTVAVLGHGLGMMYPKMHERLSENIVACGGLLLSEFPLDTQPDHYTFPARNRIIAGLSLGTVVIEAAEGSGSLITADLALEYGKEVFAVPGPIFDAHYAGCHSLITRGTAKLVTSPSEILDEIGVVPQRSTEHSFPAYTPESPQEEAILNVLTRMPISIDDLAEKTSLSVSELGSTLTILELRGVVENVGGGRWVARG